jgi:hypothetical protein
LIMMGQGFVKLRQPVLEQFFHDRGDAFVQFLALFLEQPVVHHLLGQGMLEDVLQIRLKGSCPDQIELFQAG